MFHHVVLFEFSPETTAGEVTTCLQKMDELKTIPCVRSFVLSENQNRSQPDSWTHGAIMLFDDEHSMRSEFGPHPLHSAFLSTYVPMWKRYVGVDLVD